MKLTANAWSNDITQLNSKVLSNETNKLVSSSLYSNNSKLTANSLSINTKILRSNLLKNDSSTRLSTNEEYLKTDRTIHMKTKNDEVKSLDQILKSISSSNNTNTCLTEQFPEDDSVNSSKKRNSFLALESLKDESDHFKRFNSIDHKTVDLHKEKQQDDGVLAKYIRNSQEDDDSMPAVNVGISRVRSYVYGMEAMLHTNKTTVLSTTDSLESRLSDKITSGFSNRSQDWYRRRKSYGFEQVHKPKVDQTNSIVIGNKNSIESPTDVSHSRSTGIVVIPPIFKSNQETSKITTSKGKSNCTVINLNSESINSVNNSNLLKQSNELINVMNNGRANDNSSEDKYMKGAEQVIITIPIISEYTTKNTKQLFQRQISIENLSKTSNHFDNQRHSLAVDDSKYLFSDIKFQNSLQNTIPINSSRIDDDFLNEFESDGNLNLGNRKPKKVEFCKTEVHFAAESGKVNIVETDEKPPPTQNFRRRRRTTSIPNTNNHNPEDANKNCLPLIHFGDTSYEKKLFGISDQDTGAKQQPVIVETYNKSFIGLLNENNNASVSVSITNDYATDHTDTDNNNSENHLRSILKNKMIKPRPYILGDDNNVIFSTEEQEGNEIWGIKLRPVNKSIELNPKTKDKDSLLSTWQFSSATNKYNESENHKNYDNNQPEFQKLLHAFKPDLISEPSVPASNVILNKEKGSISEPRRSTWSVPNQVKNDSKESKGFLTKVNFGNDETTVVANSKLLKHTTWPSHGDTQITDISSNKSAFQFSKNVTTSQFENQTATNLSGTESAKLSERQTTKLLPKEDPSQNERKKNRNRFEFVRNQYINRYMSSPLLVGNSPESSLSLEKPESVIEKQKRIGVISEYMHSKESSTVPPKSLPKKKIQIQSIYKKDTDLIHSPKPIKRVPIRKQTNENKSNLSQHYNHREYVNLSSVIRDDSKNVVNKSKISYIAKVPPTKSTKRPDSPSIKRSESPIYENIDEVLSGLHSSMEKESAILQELTRAADKILQAVNGYTDDDSTKLSTDSEDENKKHRLKMYRKPDDSLSTISETKSWKQVQNTKQKQAEVNKNIKKPKTRTTSSTSSIESISRESQKIVPPVRMNRASKLTEDKNRKKIAISNSEVSRTTKARRLQRANSREALLQLHGSSSEDMSNEILRKPRMVRRNKTQQSSAEESNNTNEPLTTHTAVPRRRKSDCRRSVDRVPVTSQQETRQKSSVSAVKKEAATTRVKSSEIKINEDLRKRSSIRRDTISSRGNNILTNSRISSTTTPITSTSTKQRSISATTSSTAKTTMRAVHLNSDMTLRKVSQNEGM